MLLCGSCNRAKSWSCEHCANWKITKETSVCLKCYWQNPESYSHIAEKEVRRIMLQWEADEVKDFDVLEVMAERSQVKLPDFIKQIIAARAEGSK